MLTNEEITELFDNFETIKEELESIIKRKNFVKDKRKKIINSIKKKYNKELTEQLLILTKREIEIIEDTENIIPKITEISETIPNIPDFSLLKKIIMITGTFTKTIKEITTKSEYILRFTRTETNKIMTETKTKLEEMKKLLKEEETLIKNILEHPDGKEQITFLKKMINSEKNIRKKIIDIKKKTMHTFNKLGNIQAATLIRSLAFPLGWVFLIKAFVEGADTIEAIATSQLYGTLKDLTILSYTLIRFSDKPEQITEKIKETYKKIKTEKDLKELTIETKELYRKYPHLLEAQTMKY